MGDNDNRKKNWLIKIGAFFSGPLALLFTAAAVIVGVFGSNLVGKYNQHPDAYLISVAIVGGAYLLVIIVTLIVVTLIFSKDRNKEIAEIIENQPQTCKEIKNNLVSIQKAATHFQTVLAGSVIEKSVMVGSEVDDLEASVCSDRRIIILTSKFILEGKDDFSEVIIQNFRKGVKYEYFVPDAMLTPQGTLDKYWECVKNWYSAFSCFMKSLTSAENLKKEAFGNGNIASWSPQYIDLIDKFIDAHNKRGVQKNKAIKDVRDKTKKMFSEQIIQYALEPSLFFITVAMYQQVNFSWRAIIKLPTERPEETFVAFSLDHANITERDSFFSSIQNLSSGKTPIPIDARVFPN